VDKWLEARQDNDECPEVKVTPQNSPENEVAIVACGWFWGPQLKFLKVKGVVRCLVGYSGGHENDPTYRVMKDHTEAILVEFDPKVITYEDILLEWSRMNYPYVKDKTQYRSAIWYLSDEQEDMANEVVAGIRVSAPRNQTVYVDIERVTKFYKAEEYHQNFLTKRGGKKS